MSYLDYKPPCHTVVSECDFRHRGVLYTHGSLSLYQDHTWHYNRYTGPNATKYSTWMGQLNELTDACFMLGIVLVLFMPICLLNTFVNNYNFLPQSLQV